MRGIHEGAGGLQLQLRISPAHAGNTDTRCQIPRRRWDQPRTCGEYAGQGNRPTGARGSAPHMRGILVKRHLYSTDGGISPAHAGNTLLTDGWDDLDMDQPRTCGEYQEQWLERRRLQGSAPHMRGIQSWEGPVFLWRRISPAHAGNTSWVSAAVAACADQPRTCGEYPPSSLPDRMAPGSAPHMRGIPDRIPRTGQPQGISPAHAGNT